MTRSTGFAAAASNNSPNGHRGRADDPLYRIRRVLRRGAEHLIDTGGARLMAVIDAGDKGGHVTATWVAAQELCAIYRCRDRDQAAGWLYDWTVPCIDSGLTKLSRLAARSTPDAPNFWPTSSPVASATEAPKP